MDENKIEITVELDTSKAEKQADDLNDALVDGAKDANKEFKKYSDDVNKNLNKIKQQVNKTFDGAKMANSLTSKVGKALNGIKNKINSILGNINVKTTVNANSSSQQGSTGSSGASSMGASLATGGLIGSQLVKALSLDKPLQQARNFLDTIKDIAKGAKSIKIGEHDFGINFIADNIYTYQMALQDVEGEHVSFGQTVDTINGRLKDIRKEFEYSEVSIYDMESALNDTLKVLEEVGLEGGLIESRYSKSYDAINKKIEEVIAKINEFDNVMVDADGNEMLIDVREFDVLKKLVNDLIKATQGFNKFKLQVANTMTEVRNVVDNVVGNIKSKLSNSMFSPLVNGIQKLKTTLSSSKLGQAFKQGFQEPQKYIDNMKAKIKAWADNHKKATDKVKSANKSVGGSFKSLLQQVLPFASIYGVFNGLKTSITSFADGLQQSGKFATVFGNETQKMSEWLNEINSKVTTSKSTLMDFSSTLYRMGKNMGVATDDALSMAQSMTELGADLEAFTGDANSIDALAGALRGEYDSLQNYGYSLSASAVEARALAMGLDSASESALMMARQSLILEQSGDVLGYASGQAQTLSGQMAMLRKNFQALGNAIGSCFAGLLQVVLPVLNSIVQAVTQAFNKLAGLINSIFGLFGVKVGASGSSGGGVVGDAVGGIVDNLGSGLDGAGSDVADNLASGAESAKEIAKGLMGIDEINTIGSPSDSGGGSGSGSGSSGAGGTGGLGDLGGLGSGLGETTSVLEEVNNELTKFQKGFLAIWNELVDGFNRHKDAIISLWNELKSNLNALGQEMADFFVSAWQNGLDRTVNLIGGIVGAITETALRIANSVVEVVTNLFNHLNPDNNENTKKFIDAINYLLEQIEGFITDAGKWFSQFATACQPFINNLGDIAMIVGSILAEVLADAIQLVRDFMNSWVGQAIIEGVAGALEWLSGVLESCLGFIQEHITFFESLTLGILGAWGAFKLINIAIGIWNGLMTIFASIGAICSGVATALGGAIAFLTSPIGLVVVAIGALIAIGVALYKNWDEVKAWCTKAWDAICKGIQDAGKVIATTFDYMKTTAINKCKDIWNNIKTIWNGIKSFFSQVLNAIKNTISGVLNGIKTVFSGAWNVIKTGVSATFNGIKNAISTVMNGIKSTISGVINGIKTVFTNGFNGAKTTVVNIFNGIKTGIQKAMNGARDIVKGIIDKIKGFFKFTVSLPKIKLPHFTIKPSGWKIGDLLKGTIPSLGISWYSDGGIFPNKRLIGVGDASKGIGNNAEAIIPLDRLWSELGKQFTKQNQVLNKGNNQPVNITLKLDGREISKATFKNFEELSRLGIIDLSTLV